MLRLTAAGQRALAELRAGPVRSTAAGTLARRLTDAGLAHPRPPALAGPPDVTVLIPVRDRPELLDRCLTALGRRYPVLVVDDGSVRPGRGGGRRGQARRQPAAACRQRRPRGRAEHRPGWRDQRVGGVLRQ